MKRWTLRILMCLLLGVVTTVCVAVGSVWAYRYVNFATRSVNLDTLDWFDQDRYEDTGCMPPASRYHDTFEQIRRVFDSHVPRDGTEFISAINVGYFNSVFSDETAIRGWGQDHSPYAYSLNWDVLLSEVRIRVGWPARAFRARQRVHAPATDTGFEDHVLFASSQRGKAAADAGLLTQLNLPMDSYRPILPGFLINTLFYAAIWFAIIFGWRAHMRIVRRWQGHCPMCHYDLRSDLDRGCPECGWNREGNDE